jgi:DNA polymerase-3 subunit delta'
MHLSDLLLHPSDQKQLAALLASEVGSIMLEADRGFGKETIARVLASELTNSRPEYMTVIEPQETSITIEQIRSLKSFFSLKAHSTDTKRVAVLVNADTMTTEAQNSLLKLLEEPPKNCYIILTVSHPEQLLGTISSRVQTVHLRNLPVDNVKQYFQTKGYKSVDIDRVASLANGLVGVSTTILLGENTAYVDSLEHAKQLLGQKHLDRLKAVDMLTKDKQATLLILDAFKIIATAGIRKGSKSQENLWKALLKASSTAEQQLAVNASTKLVLTNLFLSL